MTFFRSVFSVSALTALSRITGYARDLFLIRLCGASAMTDALVIAIKIPSFLRRIFAEGAFHASFLPQYAHSKNPKQFAGQVFSLLLLISGGMTMGVVFYYPHLIQGLGHIPPETLHHLRVYGPLCFPFVFFISAIAFYGAILNSHGKFVAFSVSSAIGNIVVLLVVWGCSLLFPTMVDVGQWFAWGVLLSGVVQLGVMLWYCKTIGFWIPLQRPQWNNDMRQFFQRFGPGLLAVAGTQINVLLIPILFTSRLLPGSMSYLHYADRLIQLPLSVIGIAFSSVLLPFFAQHSRDHKQEQSDLLLGQSIKVTVLLTLPLAMILYAMALPLVQMLYGFGKMNDDQLLKVAQTVKVYTFGLPAFVLIKIFTARLNAARDTLSPFLVGLVGIVVDVVMVYTLIQWWGHMAIAWGAILASWCTALGLMGVVFRRLEKNWMGDTGIFLGKVMVAMLVMGGYMYVFSSSWLDAGLGWRRWLGAAILGQSALGLYGAGLLAMRIISWTELKELLIKPHIRRWGWSLLVGFLLVMMCGLGMLHISAATALI